MSTNTEQQNSLGILAAIAGGTFLIWLALRHQQGLGLPGLGVGDGIDAATNPRAWDSPSAARAPSAAAGPCQVRIDVTGLQLDRVPATLSTVIARCREVGAADVIATGLAPAGRIADVMHALMGAGVVVRAAPSVWRITDELRSRTGAV